MQPLLAAGGVSGIALGFGAQKLTQNVLSGAKLVMPGISRRRDMQRTCDRCQLSTVCAAVHAETPSMN